jgi:hypothetical protein
MSDYTAIRAVTNTLRDLLVDNITNSADPGLAGVAIHLSSPREMREDNVTGVSLWLYRVSRNAYTLNHPPERPAPNRLRHPALPMDLYYLVTPMTDAPADEQLLLGRVLQVFHDSGTLRGALLRDTLAGTDEQLRLTLEPLSLEELTRVWHALNEPYQLSSSYLVQLVEIDSDREAATVAPVVSRPIEVHQILEVV